MNQQIEKLKQLHLYILKQVSPLTTEQLNTIPEGYNNNIIWNLAHLVSASQAICYVRAGLPVSIEDKYFTPFLPGTKPESFISSEEIESIKALMINSVDNLQADYEKGKFENYSKSDRIEQVYGIDVSTIDDALDFLLYHEGFHCGYIVGLKHLVGK